MQDIPIINLIPEPFRGWVVLAVAVSPYLTRAYHAVTNGGGLREIIGAIWFGTNSPKK